MTKLVREGDASQRLWMLALVTRETTRFLQDSQPQDQGSQPGDKIHKWP